MINLKEVITKYPECLESASKLHSYLVDIYPQEKRSITIITTIFDCGIAEEIKNKKGNIDDISINAYCNKLENEYAYSPKYSKECLYLWCDIYSDSKKAEKQENTNKTENDSSLSEVERAFNNVKQSCMLKPNIIYKASVGLKIENNVLLGIGTCKDKDIIIPDGVEKIGEKAFFRCSNLKSITIPDSVTSIGEYAFYNCNSLTIVIIPGSVTMIGDDAFSGCHWLSVYYTGTIDSWCEIKFDNSQANPLYCSEDFYIDNVILTEIDIMIAKKINSYAFDSYYNLTSVTIGDSVMSIGSNAFCNCSSLTSITIPDSVTSIGTYAFYNCPCVEVSRGVSYVDKWLIECDNNVTNLIIKEDTVGIADEAFCCCSSLESITIPKSVKNIGDCSFELTGLINITIPDSVRSIGWFAFRNCTSLTSIILPDSITSIGRDVFSGCNTNLKIKCSEKIKKLLKETDNYKDSYFNYLQ